jgi:hypothetical protein
MMSLLGKSVIAGVEAFGLSGEVRVSQGIRRNTQNDKKVPGNPWG